MRVEFNNPNIEFRKYYRNKIYFIKKCLTALFAAALCTASLFPQTHDDALPDTDIPEIDGSDDFFETETIDPALQHNFTIIVPVHEYDLNPHTASYSSEAQILSSLYEGLFSYDPATLEPKNALAVRYRISRNKKRWTFTLRKNAKFGDGSPITARDVCDAWLDLLAEPRAPYSSMLDIIEGAAAYRNGKGKRSAVGIRALSDTTLVVELVSPAGYLPRVLCHSAFSVYKKGTSVSSGAFSMQRNSNGEMILIKNNNYWDAEHTHIERIAIVQSDDADENAFLFNTGSADWIAGNVTVQKLLDKDCAQINAEFATEYLFFKSRKKSVWNNPDLRAALLEAVPWDELRSQAFVKAPTLVYPINGYPQVEGFTYTDSDEAASLMTDAKKKAGIPQNRRLPLVIGIPDTDYMKKQAAILADAWKALGVDVSIQTSPIKNYLESIPSWNADLFSYTWIGDFADPLAFLELFRSASTLNVAQWKNAEYDKLLGEAALYTGEERTKLLARAEQLLLDSGEVLPVSHPVSLNVIDLETTGGWSSNAFDIHPFKYLYKKRKTSPLPNIVSR